MSSCLTILVGGSASGKTAIAKRLTLNDNFVQYKPLTTRKIRVDEIDLDYRHVSVENFKKSINLNDLIFWDYLFDNYYGVGKDIKNFVSINNLSLIILPVWRVKDFLAIIDEKPLIFHLTADPSTALSRLDDRNAQNNEERILDLIRQNEVNLNDNYNNNYYKMNSSCTEEDVYNLIVAKVRMVRENREYQFSS